MSVSALPCQTCLVSPVVVSSVCKNLQRSHQAILQLAIAQLEEHETATVTPKPKTAPATYSTTSAAVSDRSSEAASLLYLCWRLRQRLQDLYSLLDYSGTARMRFATCRIGPDLERLTIVLLRVKKISLRSISVASKRSLGQSESDIPYSCNLMRLLFTACNVCTVRT